MTQAISPFEGTDHFVPPRFRVEDPEAMRRLSAEIRALAKAKNAILLAHNYQLPEVQEVADFVGDSLGLARQAQSVPQERIIFCGVHFMAESARC
jgi:quinolinate synthase